MDEQRTERTWAIVLAAGRGSRLGPVTRALCGRELPKQFVALTSRRTLLQETMDRIAPICPPSRTVVVVAEAHAVVARAQLADFPGTEVVIQPLDRGTGPGVLLPLAHVLARDPRAAVAIFPSDHHVRRQDPFVSAVRRAFLVGARAPSGVALVGVPAERPASDLGWIVPAERLGETPARVQRFVEKPAADTALLLLQAGALWNTLVMAGGGAALWRLARRQMPEQTRELERYIGHIGRLGAADILDSVYQTLPPADFSRDVLQTSSGLAVVSMIDSGWFDCGTPERLLAWLSAEADPQGILPRLRRAAAAAERLRVEEPASAVA